MTIDIVVYSLVTSLEFTTTLLKQQYILKTISKLFFKKKTIQSMQPDTKTQKYDRQLRLWQAHGRTN